MQSSKPAAAVLLSAFALAVLVAITEGCPYVKCDFPFLVNPETCSCECPKKLECWDPFTFNPKTCHCECPYVKCNYPETFDELTCSCTY
eukprot:Em0010g189a